MFTSNYPFYESGAPSLLSTPERTGAAPQYTGRGVVMAFIDSGFYPHPDLEGRILVHMDASANPITEQDTASKSGDLNWHGQMTTVIAAGSGRTSEGHYRGIASEAQLVLIKVAAPNGHVQEDNIRRALEWLLEHHQRLNVRVVNISVGGESSSGDAQHPLHQLIHELTEAGVTIVVAAGNRDGEPLLPPASAAEAITVGGVNDHNSFDFNLWQPYHHNYGHSYDGSIKPDLLAPSNWIASPILPGSAVARAARWLAPLLQTPDENRIQQALQNGSDDLGLTPNTALHADDNVYALLQEQIDAHKVVDAHHQHVDGTSVAAPIVAAVIAQILEANPRLTPYEIRAILTTTARLLPSIPYERQGAGVLNAAAAVSMAERLS
ncbi:MAG TPA: S8 family serine peptidase [Phototrophicaceae bacterium]|nr:S8 family serine peptidase [Phototrophicaceae bacterium]